MRLKFGVEQTFFCLNLFFIVVSGTIQKNDYFKNIERTNTKKYYTSNSFLKQFNFSSTNNNKNNKIRHHQTSIKFPNLSKLKTRLTNLEQHSSGTTSTIPTTRHPSAKKLFGTHDYAARYVDDSDKKKSFGFHPYPKLRHYQSHHGWMNRFRAPSPFTTTTTTTSSTTANPYDEELFNNYGDLVDDDGENRKENEQMEDDSLDYEDADNDFFETLKKDNDDNDYDRDVQAEEPTTEKTVNEQTKRYSSISEFKWAQFGTMQGVEEARRMQLNIKKSSEENRVKAAVDHYIRVKNISLCKNPIPKVIAIQQEHPNSSITYTPHCTVLHRCAEDTGCCKHEGTSCQYKERVEIPLYFYVKILGSDQAKVEKLIFYNHTECECRDKVQVEEEADGVPSSVGKSQIDANQKVTNLMMRTEENGPENLQTRCRCPKEFIPKFKFSKCFCNCEESNEDCIRMKKGKEHNSLNDRLCILNNQCGIVQCEYGLYMKEIGRCPKKDENPL